MGLKIKLISKDMRIDEIIRKYPQAADVFMNYGLHCVGCSLAGWETLEQGSFAHGMDKKTFNKMLREANEYVKENYDTKNFSDNDHTMLITNRAAMQVKKLMKKCGNGAKYMRIALIEVQLGHRYGFKFEKRKKKNDVLIIKNKVKFIIDDKSAEKIKGSTMDYISFLPGNGFKIYAPKVLPQK